jgi:hypothetical protein
MPTATLTESTGLALLGSTDLIHDPSSPEFREHAERGAAEMARTFAESVAEIRFHWRAIGDACGDLDRMMKLASDESYSYRNFDMRLEYDGSTHYDYPGKPAIDSIVTKMNVKVWEILINRMGIKNLMSIKRRAEFDEQIKKGDVPAVTEANILGLIFGLADRAAEFATESARETLKLLTPSSARYKTNSGFKVGRRVILPYYVETAYQAPKFRASYYREPEMIAIDGTFHVLDEKGPIRG